MRSFSPRQAAVCAAALVALGLAGCGVDADTVTVGASTSESVGSPSTAGAPATTTVPPTTGRHGIALPPIATASTVVPPRSTRPSTTTTTTTTVGGTAGSTTPDGLDQATFERELEAEAKLTADQARCVTEASWARFSGEELDRIYTAGDSAELPPALVSAFTEIITTCLQGG